MIIGVCPYLKWGFRVDELKMLCNSYFKFGFLTGVFLTLRRTFFPYYEMLESYLPAEGNILDLGCGHGLFTNFVAIRSRKRNVAGIDCLRSRIESARWVAKANNIRNVRFREEWLENFEMESYRAIALVDVLYYLTFAEQELLVKRCYGNLEPGGVLIIKDVTRVPSWKYRLFYAEESLKVVSKVIFGSKAWKSIYKRGFFVRHSREWENLLQKEGFRTEILVPKGAVNGWNYQPHIIYVCSR